jgi:hypothetical protein
MQTNRAGPEGRKCHACPRQIAVEIDKYVCAQIIELPRSIRVGNVSNTLATRYQHISNKLATH